MTLRGVVFVVTNTQHLTFRNGKKSLYAQIEGQTYLLYFFSKGMKDKNPACKLFLFFSQNYRSTVVACPILSNANFLLSYICFFKLLETVKGISKFPEYACRRIRYLLSYIYHVLGFFLDLKLSFWKV